MKIPLIRNWPAVVAAVFFFSFCSAEKAQAQIDNSNWVDQGIVFSAPGGGDAYYPSVIFDSNGFGQKTPLFRMWYSDGAGAAFVVFSADGVSWGAPEVLSGLSTAHHVQLVYDPKCFGKKPCNKNKGAKYRIWYWNFSAGIFTIAAISTAESVDGISWVNDQSISQDPGARLVIGSTGVLADWNQGSFGPVYIRYVLGSGFTMYYNGTNGISEVTGVAYSGDGVDWAADPANPILSQGPPGDWDDDDAVYGTVVVDGSGFHYWYSGGSCNIDPVRCPANEGIGYAFSLDGINWSKDAVNPIFHITDGTTHRDSRTYTPTVVDDGSGELKMYYSAVGSAEPGRKKIGMAALALPG